MMLSLPSIILLTALTIVHGQAPECYSSLDCHGNVVNVVLPEKADASAFPSECCSAAVRGLSYLSQDGGTGCQNCYTDTNFESQGDKFYLGLFGNFRPNNFFRIGKVRLSVSPIKAGQSQFTLDFQGKDNKYTAPTEVELKAEDVNLDSVKTRDQAIIVRSENGDELSVVAYAEEYSSSDTFKVMPCVRLPNSRYEYYAVSVPRAGLTFTNVLTQEEISAPLQGKSAMVIVTTEDNTEISITLTQDIVNIDANDILDQIGGGDTLRAGEVYTFTFPNGAQTLYLASDDDLTGSRVVSSKPIAFISGHECGTVPFNIHYCDQLIEQLPPTSTWGRRFITAPIAARTAVDIFKVLASRDGTIFQSSCFSDILMLDAGEVSEFNISSSSFCYFESNQPVLLVQFSVASNLDQVLTGDPFMVVVPPVEQYRNSYNISIFNTSVQDPRQAGMNYINILIPADSASPDEVRFDGQPVPPAVQFREIPCIVREGICAYAAQMNIGPVPHVLATVNSNAMLNAIVYWLSLRVGSGYFAGMTQNPIALPSISLDGDAYIALENATLSIAIFRSGDLTLPLTVYLTTAPISGDNAALVGEDFIPETTELIFTAEANFLNAFISFVDDVFPEGPEEFEVFLSAAPGALVVSPAYASVTILNDDPPLPVMNVSFAITDITVSEGEGVVTLMLEKTEGAIGPVSVRIFTTAATALDGRDFAGINDTLEFGVDVTQMEVVIFIIDNSALEDVEQFIVEIEPIPGVFPIAVMDSVATVTITDNDVVVLGFERANYFAGELSEATSVRVQVLFGQLERSVAVWINSTEASTATPDQDFVEMSRVLTFDADRTTESVGIGIFHDFEREIVTETIDLQLSLVEEERGSGLLLLPNRATVSIADNDVVEVSLSPVRGSVREGDGGARVNVSVVQGSLGGDTVSFVVSTVNGSAQSGFDYEQMETRVSLSGQNPFEELLITVINDGDYDGPDNEEFFVQIRLDPNGQNSERVRISPDLAEVSINIVDNELRPVARIGFAREVWTVSEDAGELILLVESDGVNVDPVTLLYSLNGTGTAQGGSDFILPMDTLVFPPGGTSASIVIPILDDNLPEVPESFFVSLSPGLDVELTTALATVMINDNDAVMVRFSMPSYTVSEAALMVSVAVQVSSASEPVRVNVSTTDATALAGVDYMPVQMQLLFLPGEFEKMISINLVNDSLIEDSQEFFSVSLHSPISDLRVELQNPTSNIIIIDDDRVDTPLAPSLSVSTISATSASLEWTQNLAQPVIRYFLSWTYTGPCGSQPPQSMLISGSTSSFTITDLEEGGSYTFGLTAINGEGTSPVNTTTGQTLLDAPSGAPRNLQTTLVTEANISIQWDEIECLDQNGPIIGYTVLLNGSPLSTTLPSVREFTLTGLSPRTSYTISVFGANAQGNGPSISITEQTARPPVDTPLEPSLSVSTISATSASLEWTQNLAQPVIRYFLSWTYTGPCASQPPQSMLISGSASSFTITNLEEGGSYTFGLTAINGEGTSPESSAAGQTLPAAPTGAPRNLQTTSVTETSISIQWDEIECLEQNGPITSYSVSLSGNPLSIVSSNTRELTLAGLFPQTSYTISVFGANAQGNGPSRSITVQTVGGPMVMTFRFRQPMYMFMENVGTGTVCVDKIGETDQTVTVTVRGGTQSGPFTEMLMFAPNVNSSCIDFNVLDDDIALEDTEEFVWTLDPPPSVPRVDISGNTTRVVIIDDDILTLNLEKARDIPEAIGVAQACITFSNPFARAFEISPSVGRPSNSSAPAIATPGVDYGDVIAPIMANPGDSQACLNIEINNDSLIEERQECLMVSFIAEPLVNLEIGINSSVCCIVDDDTIIIGFTNTSYTVDEGIGSLLVEVEVTNPPGNQPLPASVDIYIQSVSGSAIGGSDYQNIIAEFFDVILTFSDTNRRESFPVVIIDDPLFELDVEDFTLELRFDPFGQPPSNVILRPNVSVVTILDNELPAIEPTTEPTIDPTGMLRLVGGSTNLEGRVEIFALGDWGTVCDDDWDILDALVVCRQLGFASAIEAFERAMFGQGSGEILLDNVECTGSESRLIDCPANSLGNHNCGHNEDAGVRCLGEPECTDRSVRLMNGSSSLSGRLEVCFRGRWGTVCDDQFESNSAMVACRQLGNAGGTILPRGSYPFGSESSPIWLDNVRCTGTEANLFDCPANAVGDSNCDHDEDIGVQCTAGG